MPKINVDSGYMVNESIEFISSMCRKYIVDGCKSCPLKYNDYNRHIKECWAEINCSVLYQEIRDSLYYNTDQKCRGEYAKLLGALRNMAGFCDSYAMCRNCPFDDSSSNIMGRSLCSLTNMKPCEWQGVLSSV